MQVKRHGVLTIFIRLVHSRVYMAMVRVHAMTPRNTEQRVGLVFLIAGLVFIILAAVNAGSAANLPIGIGLAVVGMGFWYRGKSS